MALKREFLAKRRKPRDLDDLEVMQLRALERIEKYPWRVRENGVIELPWFIERFKELEQPGIGDSSRSPAR